MEDNELHQWLIDSFGPVQGEMAWKQFSALPESIRDQIMSQGVEGLPKPSEVRSLAEALTAGGLNTAGDVHRTMEEGPINVKLAQSIALNKTREAGSASMVSAEDGAAARQSLSEANLWLDTVTEFDPVKGQADVLTRAEWVERTLPSWASFAAPVAESMNDALASVLSERLGGAIDGEVSGMFAGPVPIPIPDDLKDPAMLMKLLGNTSFAMQLGQAAGNLSSEVHGSFDQGIALLKNPAGALIPENIDAYAKELEIDRAEVMGFLALHEVAHARLYASVPWLMPRFEALIGKYARGISIDLDAMEEQLREAEAMNPESIAGAVNLAKVGISDSPEQKEALDSLETLLALVEGWVDCVVWRAGMAHLPHIEQLREMMRRERAVGGPAELTFESLLGLKLRPKRLREAAGLWESITTAEGAAERDRRWGHPDLLPTFTDDKPAGDGSQARSAADGSRPGTSVDWDAELSKLLDENNGGDNDKGSDGGN
ncbi:zinc-dependent metalloprotease [Bifidobacterium sp. 82T24]|uniref:zinc-dependent metalloprotease n=1 Tax=Bifidobacterium pluvialisilvae TaxID=2834436 RepID=UPI001C575F69|nr:zinc-dependent metalloprotease [Bifidobacterium pluvialisilvae]MBW3087713.1 zinc-dependent metalloprotease [Bifidobacterium pluvialisilvae]